MDKIAKGLGAKRPGDVDSRFRVPSSGGRPTDPAWTERRLVPLAPRTLKKLEAVALQVRKHGIKVEPMQLAALLIEKETEHLDQREAEALIRPARRASRG